MLELRAMMKRVWQILPTVMIVSLLVCGLVWLSGLPHDTVAPIVAVVVCIMFFRQRAQPCARA